MSRMANLTPCSIRGRRNSRLACALLSGFTVFVVLKFSCPRFCLRPASVGYAIMTDHRRHTKLSSHFWFGPFFSKSFSLAIRSGPIGSQAIHTISFTTQLVRAVLCAFGGTDIKCNIPRKPCIAWAIAIAADEAKRASTGLKIPAVLD